MVKRIALALLAAAASPALAQTAPARPAPAKAEPAAEPAHLALARTAVESVWPLGTYERMADAMMSEFMGGMFDMKMSDMVPVGELSDKEKGQADVSIGDAIAAKDPHFKERMRITFEVVKKEMGAVMAKVEPAMRDGLTKAFARKFTAAQLADMNRFFATPSGKAYARESLLVFMDPELMKAMMSMMPEMMKAMPAVTEKVKAATAHLPPPPQEQDEDEQEKTEVPEPTA